MKKRDSHEMTVKNWESVNAIAGKLGCSSWRVMLRKIAQGSLIVEEETKTPDGPYDVEAVNDRLDSEPVTKPVVAKVPEYVPARSRLTDRSNAAPIGRPKL
jgi:hypothetical protein